MKSIDYIDKTIFSTVPNEKDDPELNTLVKRVQTHHHSTYCSKSNRYSCRFDFPKPCIQKTRIVTNIHLSSKNRGRTKNDVFINDYTPILLRHWRANMDSQFIQNAEGPAYYVVHICAKVHLMI